MKNSTSKQVFWFTLINYLGITLGIVSTLFIYPENTEFLGIIRTIEAYSQVIFPLLLLGKIEFNLGQKLCSTILLFEK